MDPRIPDDYEYFEFKLTEANGIEQVNWFVNDELIATTPTGSYPWKLARGNFTLHAEVRLAGDPATHKTQAVSYRVN